MKTLYENEEKNRDSSMFENPGEVEKNFITQINKYMENEYEKMSFLALEKETESATLEYIESLLQTKEGIRNLLYRIQNITEMDNSFSNIDDTVMFFYDKVNQDICKKAVFEKYNGDIDNLALYWDIYISIKSLEKSYQFYIIKSTYRNGMYF